MSPIDLPHEGEPVVEDDMPPSNSIRPREGDGITDGHPNHRRSRMPNDLATLLAILRSQPTPPEPDEWGNQSEED
ncbi:hypothetical protein [Mesorhizobium sp. B2-3-5]|uniref:hypothetical protein n=1 Tax=Mesorhizobium sp. B2-3-5 TaxID=2589958 RepID=UPI00112908BD|nr:hypothetical protein [Mesorhizobium sp. B2-3-5]TPM21603.1 hypothetical protein FJ958_25815 [Mesorhizobium sp. B2-3-5]